MGTGSVVTLGVSLAVPEPYGTLLQDRRVSFGDAAAHGIPTHITLLPPTEVAAHARPAIEAHLARVARGGRSFPVRLSGTGTFRPLSPVVFVRVAEGGSACSWLQERVRGAEGPLVRELQFPYHPHVTIAHGIDESAMDRAFAELADFECAWTASGFALYEQGEDAVWRLRREFSFADAGAGAGADGGVSADVDGGAGGATDVGTSVIPGTSVAPGTAVVPSSAMTPCAPVTSGIPGAPGTPAVPAAPAGPGAPVAGAVVTPSGISPATAATASGAATSSDAASAPAPLALPAACRPPAQRRPVSRPPATL